MNFKLNFIIVILLVFSLGCSKEKLGKKFNVVETNAFDLSINECSGLVNFDEKLWAINDSGGGNLIYQIDEEGGIIEDREIENILNIDWECLETDNDYIYIGDIGNNFGDRKDLKIYQLNNDLSLNQEISISYKDQINFDNRQLHNYDAEACVINEGKLWVFTKNYQNDSCNVYTKSLNQNSSLIKTSAIPTNGLVTDSYYDSIQNKLYLLTYKTNGDNFICYLNIYNGLLSNSLNLLESFLLPITEQAEAFTKIGEFDFLIGTEREGQNKGGNLYKIRIED